MVHAALIDNLVSLDVTDTWYEEEEGVSPTTEDTTVLMGGTTTVTDEMDTPSTINICRRSLNDSTCVFGSK